MNVAPYPTAWLVRYGPVAVPLRAYFTDRALAEIATTRLENVRGIVPLYEPAATAPTDDSAA